LTRKTRGCFAIKLIHDEGGDQRSFVLVFEVEDEAMDGLK
jgi:hypothetical protein